MNHYLNTLSTAGFVLERALEPGPSVRQAERVPGTREVPTLLLICAHLSGYRQAEQDSKG